MGLSLSALTADVSHGTVCMQKSDPCHQVTPTLWVERNVCSWGHLPALFLSALGVL